MKVVVSQPNVEDSIDLEAALLVEPALLLLDSEVHDEGEYEAPDTDQDETDGKLKVLLAAIPTHDRCIFSQIVLTIILIQVTH